MQSKSRLIRGRRPLSGDKTPEMLSCESGKRERFFACGADDGYQGCAVLLWQEYRGCTKHVGNLSELAMESSHT